ncbi:MAG TPA: hypothetical protein PLB48_10990 [Treponema sp.]|nr:hypothetical protein [Treponema sp.]HRS02870.1 hypothetical protein [Treponema sp.]HRU29497.1 hypothetical protein [Treponema sp.]
MLTVIRKYGPLKVYQKWFFSKPDRSDIGRITVYKQCSSLEDIPGFLRKDFFTLHIDIGTKTSDELFNDFSKTNQTKIKKSFKDSVTIYNNIDFLDFMSFFNTFAQFKKLMPLTIKELTSYKEHIRFTWIANEREPIAAHGYLLDADNGIVRLLYSATMVRDNENYEFISRSNRRLHWYDFELFKNEGYRTLDMGGLALNPKDKETEGIDFFKKSFGGTIVKQSHYESWPAYFIKKIVHKD